MKLYLFDLDGTLFDTKDINYHAYKEALEKYGFSIDYKYYCEHCNGRHYTDFLPQLTGANIEVLTAVHTDKKNLYASFLDRGVKNQPLFDIIEAVRETSKVAIVTTASRKNCYELLDQFGVRELFDLILTHEDITNSKPDPEGFIKAMRYFEVEPEETVIFEDSDVGLEAAKRSGAFYYKTFGFN